MKLNTILFAVVLTTNIAVFAAAKEPTRVADRSPAQAVTSLSVLSDNFTILSALVARDDFKSLLRSELAKGDIGDNGPASMKAMKIVSASVGAERYLVTRSLWEGHGGNDYAMTLLVDVNQSGQISKVQTINLRSGY